MTESLDLLRPAPVRGQAKRSSAEQLRSSVLDGLAQVYKTPLTAILAASAGLSEMGDVYKRQPWGCTTEGWE